MGNGSGSRGVVRKVHTKIFIGQDTLQCIGHKSVAMLHHFAASEQQDLAFVYINR